MTTDIALTEHSLWSYLTDTKCGRPGYGLTIFCSQMQRKQRSRTFVALLLILMEFSTSLPEFTFAVLLELDIAEHAGSVFG